MLASTNSPRARSAASGNRATVAACESAVTPQALLTGVTRAPLDHSHGAEDLNDDARRLHDAQVLDRSIRRPQRRAQIAARRLGARHQRPRLDGRFFRLSICERGAQ